MDELKNVRVVTPEKLVLSCRISPGDPTAEVRWYRNRFLCKIFTEIVSDEKYEIIRDGDMASLTIAASEVSDSAIYRCEAVNKFSKVRTECRVVVLGTCRILSALRYDTLNDTCTALGQDGSDSSRDLATLTFDLGGHGACG